MSETDHFVLYRRGRDAPAAEERARIRATPGLHVLDEASPRLLLVECSEAELRHALRDLEGWTCERERSVRAGND
ncbi:MAG: hypothetical protein JO157_01800 [Acetobacteraceae bacterium]|nr:hypothetical protein [Acetobacteraceae bacterium]